MPSPFPGTNPYLEHPELWSEVHHWMITLIAELLVSKLRPKYQVVIEKRVYQISGEDSLLVGISDVVVGRSSSVSASQGITSVAVALPPVKPITVNIPMPQEVREVGTGEVVTVIEVLSPKNKRPGEGRRAYENKRQKVLGSSTHIVEIDLLRGGQPMPILENSIQVTYRILVSRSDRRPQAELYPFGLQEPIPPFQLPLRHSDPEPLVDLQALLHSTLR